MKESQIDPAAKRPTWVLTIGIVCIILGLFRFFNAYEMTVLPQKLEEAREVLEKISQDSSVNIEGNLGVPWLKYKIKTDSITGQEIEELENLKSMLNSTLDASNHFLRWVVPMGLAGMVVTLIYIMGGILLLIARPFSVKFIYFALGLSILFYTFMFMVLLSDKTPSFLGYNAAIGRGAAVIIDLVLIGFAISGAKDYFRKHTR